MTRVPGIGGATSLLALAIALPLWLITATLSLARQEGDLAPVEIGAGPVREQSLGFTGRNLYSRDWSRPGAPLHRRRRPTLVGNRALHLRRPCCGRLASRSRRRDHHRRRR